MAYKLNLIVRLYIFVVVKYIYFKGFQLRDVVWHLGCLAKKH